MKIMRCVPFREIMISAGKSGWRTIANRLHMLTGFTYLVQAILYSTALNIHPQVIQRLWQNKNKPMELYGRRRQKRLPGDL